MADPHWTRQKAIARRRALIATPIIAAAVACVFGFAALDNAGSEDRFDLDDPAPAATTGPPATNKIFNPVASAAPTAGPDPTVDPPNLPEPPPVPNPPDPPQDEPEPEPEPEPEEDRGVYYANCTAARRAGAAPIYRGEPGYRRALDRDNDGVACDT